MLRREGTKGQTGPQVRIGRRSLETTRRYSDSRQRTYAWWLTDVRTALSSAPQDEQFEKLIRSAFYGVADQVEKVPSSQRFPSVEDLRPHVGSWVAVKEGKVIYAAAKLVQILSYLSTTGQTADSTFRVPTDPSY